MACVESIKNRIDTDSFKIIIVDNASPNGTGKQLSEFYINDDIVEVIQLSENIGFARGNNVGIRKAREEGAKFICCINDDAELISDDFYSVINKKYQVLKPAIIGPEVIKRDGRVDEFIHPLWNIEHYEKTLSQVENETYVQFKKRKKYNLRYAVRNIIDHNQVSRRVFQKLKIAITGIDPYEIPIPKYTNDMKNMVMLGCCLVFTPVFFTQLSGFNDSTFLYGEEEFLQASLFMKGLHSLYVPDIKIFHKGEVATSITAGKERIKKWKFQRDHSVDSLRRLVVFLKENEEEIYHDGREA